LPRNGFYERPWLHVHGCGSTREIWTVELEMGSWCGRYSEQAANGRRIQMAGFTDGYIREGSSALVDAQRSSEKQKRMVVRAAYFDDNQLQQNLVKMVRICATRHLPRSSLSLGVIRGVFAKIVGPWFDFNRPLGHEKQHHRRPKMANRFAKWRFVNK
jgi:hypothetical protein